MGEGGEREARRKDLSRTRRQRRKETQDARKQKRESGKRNHENSSSLQLFATFRIARSASPQPQID